MQQQDQSTAGPAQPTMFSYDELLGKNGQPAAGYLTACDPRCVFENEAELEYTILHDPQALEVLADILGISIHSVANQVRTGEGLEQRADLVTTDGRWKRPLSVLELMLHELDSDHIRRGLFYAISLRTPHLVLIAPSFPPRAHSLIKVTREWLAKLGDPITVHLVALQTSRSEANGLGYYQLTPVTPTRPTPKRARAFLEALAEAAAEQGDESLMDLTLTDNRRLESYQGLGEHTRIRIYAGIDTTKISIMASSSRLRRRLHGKHLPQRLAVALAPLGLQAWEQQSGKTTLATYSFPTPRVVPGHPAGDDVARIAHAYVTLRATLLGSVGDFSRAGRATAGRILYLPAKAGAERSPYSRRERGRAAPPVLRLPTQKKCVTR